MNIKNFRMIFFNVERFSEQNNNLILIKEKINNQRFIEVLKSIVAMRNYLDDLEKLDILAYDLVGDSFFEDSEEELRTFYYREVNNLFEGLSKIDYKKNMNLELCFEEKKFLYYQIDALARLDKEKKFENNLSFIQQSEIIYMKLVKNFKFEPVITISNKIIDINQNNYFKLLQNQDVAIRTKVFDNHMKPYVQYQEALSQLFYSHVTFQNTFIKKIFNKDYFELILNEDGIEYKQFTDLVNTISSNTQALKEYTLFICKKKAVKKMNWVDLFCIDSEKVENYDFQTIFFEAFSILGKKYQELMQDIFSTNRVYFNTTDIACSYTLNFTSANPIIVMDNEINNLDSLIDLAHECGHAVHYSIYNNNQLIKYNEPLISLQEIFSSLNELIIIEHLLNSATTDIERKIYLNYWLERFRGKVFRQNIYTELELFLYSSYKDELDSDELKINTFFSGKVYKYFESTLELREYESFEWLKNTHIFDSFYNYKYSLGYLAAIQILENLRTKKIDISDIYQVLASNGNIKLDELLLKLKIDINSNSYIHFGIKQFQNNLKKLQL